MFTSAILVFEPGAELFVENGSGIDLRHSKTAES